MRKLLFVLLLVWAVPVFGQKVVPFGTSALLQNRETSQDSAMVTLSSGERAWRSSTSQDTILTAKVNMEHLNGEFSLEFRKVNVAGTDTAQVNILLGRGYGTPDSSGQSRHQLVITNTDTTMQFYLADSTWVSKRPFTWYAIEIQEKAAQQNDYILNLNHYSPDGKASNRNVKR